jgi:hypothetical protein
MLIKIQTALMAAQKREIALPGSLSTNCKEFRFTIIEQKTKKENYLIKITSKKLSNSKSPSLTSHEFNSHKRRT